MYHRIVRSRIGALFDAVNAGNFEPVLAGFARRFEHYFLGEEHALAGARHSLGATRAWYERLYRLLPDIRFELTSIAVAGPPWNTIATVQWRESNSGADGVRTENHGVHIVHLAWGRMTRLLICPDTRLLQATLDRLHAHGIAEAHAAPIVD